jgi:phospholipid/cholesterol/gamma-HCH transport system ATP-binding protein
MIQCENICFSYVPEQSILNNINLNIASGKLIALMGSSGCGKTTLLRLLCGLQQPTQGHIYINQQKLSEIKSKDLYMLRKKMGMLFQFGALFTDLDIFENIAFPLRQHSSLNESMIHDIVLMKLNAVGLRGARRLMPSQISGGMARRVALARAIALDPSIVFYDEPFAGLDPISMGVIADLIKQINHAFGLTSIIISHDVHETFLIADEIYILSNGEIIAHGTPQQLRESDNPFVQQFILAKAQGPVPFHYAAKPLGLDFCM